MILASLVQLFAGAMDSGVTNDEPVHVSRTNGWLNSGWYVPEALIRDGRPDPSLEDSFADSSTTASPWIYGPAFSAVAHGLNVVVGNEEISAVSFSADATAIRHILSALIGALAAFACGAAVWSLTSSWRFGLWTVAALLAVPNWSGMSFFNPKDIPAAAGYTLITVGLILAATWLSDQRWKHWRFAAITLLCAGGLYLGVGTRLAFWLPAVVSIFSYLVLAVIQAGSGRVSRKDLRDNGFAVGLGIVVGIISLIMIYPAAFGHPFELMKQSVTASSDYPWTGFTLTAGRLVDESPPWWYLPVWGFASTPVLIGLMAVGGSVAGLAKLLRKVPGSGNRLANLGGQRELALLLVLLQLLLMSAGSMILGSTMYSGLRQHLYIVPAAAILAGVGAHRLWLWSGRSSPRLRIRRRAVAVLLTLAVAVPMAEGFLLFPYHYVYVNPLAGIGGVNGRWEAEYWWSSAREARSRVPANVDLLCLSPVGQEGLTQDSVPEDCGDDLADPFFSERPSESTGFKGQTIGKIRSASLIPRNCEDAGSVTRWLRGEDVLMSYLLDCKIPRVPSD